MGSLTQPEPGWWHATDGLWYPPELHPNAAQRPAPLPPPPGFLTAFAPPVAALHGVPALAAPIRTTTTVHVTPGGNVAIGGAAQATSTVGNVLWVLIAGFWLALAYGVAGILNMMTIIGIPFGIQSFKLAGYALWPFGRIVVQRPGRDAGLSTLGNVLWFIFGGFWLVLCHLFVGVLLCVTVIGFPLGLASFKMAGLALAPFGKQVVSRSQLAAMPGVTVVSEVG
jgi:uncharacterized membrane protein YccF (DUF307 family)